MKIWASALFLTLGLAGDLIAQTQVRSRSEILAPIEDATSNPEGRFAELDINNDGKDDLIVSKSVSLGGTGGLLYDIYVRADGDDYRLVDQVLASVMSLENLNNTTRVWSYSHSSAQSGVIWYFYFDRKGVYRKSPSLEILTGDGGTVTGNAIFQAVFNDNANVKMKVLDASMERGSSKER